MLGSQTNEDESLKILDYAISNGINFWDTADNYNQGKGERIISRALEGRRDQIFLATKVCCQMGEDINSSGLSRRHILSAVKDSLLRLRTDYIDLYYMHIPDVNTEIEETLDTMSQLVRTGLIRYYGISNYPAWQIADMLAICDKKGYIAPIITQNVYNIITRSIESELVPFLKAHKMGLAVYNPLAGGLLTGKHRYEKPEENTRFINNAMYQERYWKPENFEAIEKLKNISNEVGISLAELALKWCISRAGVTSTIVGVSKISQLEQNLKAVEGRELDKETLKACDEVWGILAGKSFGYIR
jgi:aryl-alcohol dehydrogenase-like predicted oxidoreductase